MFTSSDGTKKTGLWMGVAVAVATLILFLWLGPTWPFCTMVLGLVAAACASWSLTRARQVSDLRRLESHLSSLQRALHAAQPLAEVAVAASAREDPVNLVRTLVRTAASALHALEVHALLSPSQVFPEGLHIESRTLEPLPLARHETDHPYHLLELVLATEEETVEWSPDGSSSHWFGVAIADLRQTLGILAVHLPQPASDGSALAADDQLLLKRMAAQVGLALENSALLGEVVRRAWEVAGIADLAGAIAEASDLPRVLALAAERATIITGAATSAIILADYRRKVWKVEAAWGLHRDYLLDLQAPLSYGLPGEVIRRGQMRFAQSSEVQAHFCPESPLSHTGQAIFIPLGTPAESPPTVPEDEKEPHALGCIACFTAEKASAFSAKDVRVLTILAAEVAIAVEGAQLLRRTLESEKLQRDLLGTVEQLRQETNGDAVLERACAATAAMLGVSAVAVCQRVAGNSRPALVHSYPPTPLDPPLASCPTEGIPTQTPCPAMLALLNRRTRHARVTDAMMVSCPWLHKQGAKVWACIPFSTQEGSDTAFLLADCEDPDHFDEAFIARAEFACSHIGAAYAAVCAAEAQRQEAEVSGALLSIVQLVATERDTGRILSTLNEVSASVLASTTATALAWNGSRFTHPSEDRGVYDTHLTPPSPQDHDVDSELAKTLVENKQPTLVGIPGYALRLPEELLQWQNGMPVLVCPMLSHEGTLLGALFLRLNAPARRFPQRDVAIALGIARLGALAIDHAQSEEKWLHAERMKALGEMSAGVAHDLNNLLAAILGNAQLALMNLDDVDAVSAALQTVSNICRDGSEMVRRIHSLTGPMRPAQSEVFDLASATREALEVCRSLWRERPRSQSVREVCEFEENVLVRGSVADFREAIVQLVVNATEAMPAGGQLTVRCYRKEPWAVLEVGDTGCGMDEETCRRVFDPFFTTKAQRGHGLGLSMVYGVVHRHLGTVEVESAVGEGSTFTIRVPLAAEGSQTTLPSPESPIPALRILVADDEKLVAEALAGILRRLGHTVDVAASGEEALALWQTHSYELVITDHSMPGMTGAELAQKLKEQAASTPVILITGWDAGDHASFGGRSVADLVLQKPVGREELLGGIAAVLQHRAQNRGVCHAGAPTGKTSPPTVFIVDDDPSVSFVMRVALTTAGYAVECFADAPAALARISEHRPDLIITDFNLDGMSGAQLARQVKQIHPKVPVMVVTGWRPNAEELVGVDHCLDKPFRVPSLLDAVAAALLTHSQPND